MFGCAVRDHPSLVDTTHQLNSALHPPIPITYARRQVIIANQMATKLLTNDNKPAATFEAGEKAILMPQLGEFISRHLLSFPRMGSALHQISRSRREWLIPLGPTLLPFELSRRAVGPAKGVEAVSVQIREGVRHTVRHSSAFGGKRSTRN